VVSLALLQEGEDSGLAAEQIDQQLGRVVRFQLPLAEVGTLPAHLHTSGFATRVGRGFASTPTTYSLWAKH
jgi:hypothetical protein